MGNTWWSQEEDADLKRLSIPAFMEKWGRTKGAIVMRRHTLGLSKRTNPKVVDVRNETPKCVYCYTKKGECTCRDGHRCRDQMCAWFNKKKGPEVVQLAGTYLYKHEPMVAQATFQARLQDPEE